jgi:hypothetical protein
VNNRLVFWLVPAFLYLVFATWYTGLGGPLKPQEIQTLLAAMEARGISADRRQHMRRFMEEDTGRQIFVINALDMAENPTLPAGANPGATSDDLMNHYMEHMYPEQLKRASHPIFYGEAIADAIDLVGMGEEARHWERGAIFRYRSRRDLMEIATNPAFGERHDYKLAALDKTIAYPMESIINFGDPRVLLFLIVGFVIALVDILVFGSRR